MSSLFIVLLALQLKGAFITVKALPAINVISVNIAVRHGSSLTYTASLPGKPQQIIDMSMNGVGCRAKARIMGIRLNTVLRHLKNSGHS